MKPFRALVMFTALWTFVAPAHGVTTPSRNRSTYVLLGLESIKMKDFAFTNLGNVGVNNAGGTMQWGRKSFFSDGSQVTTDVLRRAGKQSSLYDFFANTMASPLTASGAVVRNDGPLTWSPLPLITPLPAAPSCQPGSTPTTVVKGGSMKLPAGSYGAVIVSNGATLELTGGGYCFGSL